MSVPEEPLDGSSVQVFHRLMKFGACVCSDSHRTADLGESLEQVFIVTGAHKQNGG